MVFNWTLQYRTVLLKWFGDSLSITLFSSFEPKVVPFLILKGYVVYKEYVYGPKL